jgi:hypothetical protein
VNRTFALFLAIAVLIAHTLAIHKTVVGEVAPPYDVAHVAFRLARNLVQSGTMSWDGVALGFESYPSLLWIAVAAGAERLYMPVTVTCQVTGAVSAVLTVIVLAQFSRGRLAGVIAPLLFVVSSSAAAAAGSGTEAATFALLMTLAFLAFEQRWWWTFAISMTLVCLTRAEGVLFMGAMLVMELQRLLARESANGRPRASLLAAFLPPIVMVVLVTATRLSLVGVVSSPWLTSIFEPVPGQWERGLDYLLDFLISSGGPLLVVFPLYYLLRGSLSALGVRAFFLVVLWFGLVVLAGGGSQPLFQAIMPILAILFVAVQEAMTVALDSRRGGLPAVTWVLFLMGLALSALVGKYPGDLGPLEVEQLHRDWMTPRAEPRFGFQGRLGRLGQVEEIDTTERLRAIGIYLRDQIDADHAVLTPWPGAIGYLSRVRVIDAFGRTTPAPGTDRTQPWNGRPRVDVVAMLESRPEYILPTIRFEPVAPSLDHVAATWAEGIDRQGNPDERAVAIAAEMRSYELITVPVDRNHVRYGVLPRNRFFLLRRTDLDLAPKLHLTVDEDTRRFQVEAEHRSQEQIVDLRIHAVDAGGKLWSMSPTGTFERTPSVIARSSILLFPTGMRRVLLVEGALPPDLEVREMRASLRNPSSRGEAEFTRASDEVQHVLAH